MAKVIFDITENDAVPTDKSGHISVPVTISVGIEGLNDGQPGHSECLALIMKQNASDILMVIKEIYIMKLKGSGNLEVNAALFNVNEQQGDKNVH
ncbi:hypothetical protein M5J15_09380 [Serratia symbiotica]|uniref:hypothetical protein n=1 Tax=Serratia symbiotica TaxID=138074 RepID=UPI00209062AD|nr:hypothetical protein [Serratia symbiotica]USS94949.1 hypothetical protein M5J15_09380 [Serratia symbiotica]